MWTRNGSIGPVPGPLVFKGLKQVAICADTNADETILSIKLNVPDKIAPILTAISWFCRFDIASVFADVSVCTAVKAVVVAYFISQNPVVTKWSVCVVVTAVA